MLKTKYERMSKEEKKDLFIQYKKTDKGKEMMLRLFRLNIIGVIGIFYSIYLFVADFKNLKWHNYLVIIPLLLISIFFIFMAYRLKKKVLNQFAIKKK